MTGSRKGDWSSILTGLSNSIVALFKDILQKDKRQQACSAIPLRLHGLTLHAGMCFKNMQRLHVP